MGGGSGEQVEDEEEEEEEFSMEALKAAEEEKKAKKEQKEAEKKAKIVVKAEKEDWAVGEMCLAFRHEDRNFYKAKVRQVSKKGPTKVCVTFVAYGNSVVLTPAQLLVEGAVPTKEHKKSAYYLHTEAVKAKKAAAKLKKERMREEKLKKRRARR